MRRQAADWNENLRGALLVFDANEPGASTEHHPVDLEREPIGRPTVFASQQNSTLFMCLLTGLKALLPAKTGRTDPRRHRHGELRPALHRPDRGAVREHVIVRTKMTPAQSLAQALERARESVPDAHARQELPLNCWPTSWSGRGVRPGISAPSLFHPAKSAAPSARSAGGEDAVDRQCRMRRRAGAADRPDLAVADAQGAADRDHGSVQLQGELLDGGTISE